MEKTPNFSRIISKLPPAKLTVRNKTVITLRTADGREEICREGLRLNSKRKSEVQPNEGQTEGPALGRRAAGVGWLRGSHRQLRCDGMGKPGRKELRRWGETGNWGGELPGMEKSWIKQVGNEAAGGFLGGF